MYTEIYMDIETFSHMRDTKMITPDALFRIYNWYELTLNPNLPEIINYMHDNGLRIDMSTNASTLLDFSTINNC